MAPTAVEKLRKLCDLAIATGYVDFGKAEECFRRGPTKPPGWYMVEQGWIKSAQLQELLVEVDRWEAESAPPAAEAAPAAAPASRDPVMEQLIQRRREAPPSAAPAAPREAHDPAGLPHPSEVAVGAAANFLRRRWPLLAGGLVVLVLAVAGILALVAKAREVEILLGQAAAFEKEGRLAEAAETYGKVTKISGSNADAKRGIERVGAAIAQRLKDEEAAAAREKARQEFEKTVEPARLAIERIQRMLDMEETDHAEVAAAAQDAEKRLTEAIAKVPDSAYGHLLLGRTWEVRGRDSQAAVCWRKSIESDPKSPGAHYELGRLMFARHYVATKVNHTQGEAALTKEAERELALVAADPNELRRKFAASALAFLKGDLDAAHYKTIAALDAAGSAPGAEDLLWLAGISAAEPEKRIEYFNKVVDRVAYHRWALLGRAATLEMLGNPAAAIADYTKVLRIHPLLPDAFLGRGRAQLADGKRDAAIADLEKAIEVCANDWPGRDITIRLIEDARRKKK